ncbi:MAG: phosphoglycerate kinase [Candidatus Pacebacteria bacterium CG_4_10_14_0_8_um_filter_42_14]|nr:MAG: phosphoglycerate kinase [Candidatus Pacebacteria bacterium CG_4_10_14_0_8_um_filter_42_14]
MNLRSLTSTAVRGKRVLVRANFDVALHKDGSIITVEDDTRLKAALDTIHFLQEEGSRIILISHLGRPRGKVVPELSLKPIADYLKDNLGLPISFVADCGGPKTMTAIKTQQPGEIILLENLRFYPEERANDKDFAKKLASLADVYVDEAFSNAHRPHASMIGIPEFLPSFAGFNLMTEVRTLTKLISKPKKPFIVILGGAKISDKVGALKYLTDLADIVLIGGAIANNFLSAEGFEIYRSFVEESSTKMDADYVEVARELIEEHKTDRILKDNYIPLPKLLYPLDVVAAPELSTTIKDDTKIIDLSHDMADTQEHIQLQYLDIGPKTRKLYKELIAGAGTVFWNGPMGVWENELFSEGTKTIAKAITETDAYTVLGGGDTIAAANHFHVEHKFTYVSAAGGAALKFLSGEMLPGIAPLLEK